MPTPAVETLFMESFTRCAAQYGAALETASHKKLQLEDKNYDTGSITLPGTYRLADEVYACWLDMLAKKSFSTVTPAITTGLLGYYNHASAPIDTKNHPKKWKRVLSELGDLKTARAADIAAQ
jgi:hypothetical protein